jgi:D-glycero-D-manno-heptose 1,7-bisphosphate phosphatase
MISETTDLPSTLKPAVFLDRDGTITIYDGYVTSPSQLRLLPDVAASLVKLKQAGFLCILITNQSAVGRGMITVDELDAIHAELNRLLAAAGTQLDAIYSCLECPSLDDETIAEHPDRKPGPGMLLRAASDMGIDLAQSWMIGDRLSDVLAGVNAGCRSIRVRTGHRYTCPIRSIDGEYVCKYSIKEAAEFILAETRTKNEAIAIRPQ